MKREIKTTLALDGEKEFNKGMDDAQRQMRVLASESRAVTAAFLDNEGSVEALTAKNKVLIKQIDQQQEVVDALTKAVSESAQMYGEADKKTDGYRIKLNDAAATLDKMKSNLNENEQELKQATEALQDMAKAEDKVGDQADKMGKSVKNADDNTKGFKGQIKNFAADSVSNILSVTAVAAGAEKVFQFLWNTVSEASDWADDILTFSNQIGATAAEIQKLEYASKFLDVEADVMAKGQGKVVKAFNEAQTAGKDYISITEEITISTKDTNGQIKDSSDLFADAVDAIGSMANETEREAAAQDIFGKSYQELMPLIKAGSGALKKYAQEAEDMGVVVEDSTVLALGKLDDSLERTSAKIEANKQKIAGHLASITDWAATTFANLTDVDAAIANSMQFGSGLSHEAATQLVNDSTLIQNALYLTGLSEEQLGQQQAYIWVMMQNQGVPANELYRKSLETIAQGIDAATYATQTMATAQEEWDAKTQAAFDKYTALSAQYEEKVTSMTDRLLSGMGITFDKFDANLATSQKELNKRSQMLIDSTESEVDALTGWADSIEKLSDRGINQGLLQDLYDMGPEAYDRVQALNNMTDEQLTKYSDLYKQKSDVARAAAKKALEPLANDVKYALLQAEDAIKAEDEAMRKLGEDLGKGVGDGIGDAAKYIKSKLISDIEQAIVGAERKYEIHSPSEVSGDRLGEPLGIGVTDKWAAAIRATTSDVQDEINRSISKLANATSFMGGENVVYMNNYQQKAVPQVPTTLKVEFTGPVTFANDYDVEKVATKLGRYLADGKLANGG